MRRIKMELVGKQVVKTINDKHRREWFGEEWELWSSVGGLGQDLDPESYQWPFQRILPGSLPESVIGIDRSWLRYQFMVTLERGPLGKDWYEKKDIRVIRTPDPTSPALTRDTVRRLDETSFGSQLTVSSLWKASGRTCSITPSVHRQQE